MGQLGLCRVVDAAAHGAGRTLGQRLRQQSGLCVQKCPVQCIPAGVRLRLGFGGSAVGILRTVGLLCLLLAGGKPLVQGGKGGAALGQLLFPVLQGQQPGGSIFQRGQLLFSSGQRCVQCGQLGAFRFCLGSGQLGSIPRGLLLMAQGIQLIVGGKGRLCLRHLAGKNIQLGGIACVAGALGTGSFQHRQGSGKLCLLCGQLCGQLSGLLGGTQLTLYFVQLGFGVLEGSSNGLLRGLLAGQQTFQQGKGRLRLGLGVQCGKGIGIRVVGRKTDAGEQTVQLCILGGALLAEGGAFGLQALLQPGIALGAEQLAENAAALLGGSVEQLCELTLRDHGDLAELAVVQPDDLLHGGSHILGFGHRRTAIGIGEGGIRFLGGHALAAVFGSLVLRVAAHGIALAVHLKFKLHKGGRFKISIFAAQHGALAHAAAGMIVQGVCNGIEQGGLACAGIAGDKV